MSRKSLIMAAMLVLVAVTSGIVLADSDLVNANAERPVCVPNTGDEEVEVDIIGTQKGIYGAGVIILAKDDDGYYYNLSEEKGVAVKPGEELKHNITVDWPKNDETFDEFGKNRSKIVASPIPEKNYTLVLGVNANPDEGWVKEQVEEGEAKLGTCAADEEGGAPLWVPEEEPDWWSALMDNTDWIIKLITNPLQVILGGVFSLLVGGIEAIWTTILDALNLVWYGSEAESTAGMLGLADIPIFIAEIFIGMGVGIGETAFDLVDAMWDGAEDIVDGLGPLALPVTVGALIAVIVAMQRFARRLGPAFLEAIPVIGPFLKNLLLGP